MIHMLLFVLGAAFCFAKLEIEIEGRHGWAAELPTWRVEDHFLLDVFFGGRPLTGYHVWALSFVLLLFHGPFFWLGSWSWRSELMTVGAIILFWLVEDALWFVLNPHFGRSKFTRENVWWHKRWLLGLPLDYWIAAGASGALLVLPRLS